MSHCGRGCFVDIRCFWYEGRCRFAFLLVYGKISIFKFNEYE